MLIEVGTVYKMGSHSGPKNNSFNEVVFAIDAGNSRSYTGTGNTVIGLKSGTSFTKTTASFSGSGATAAYVFSGSGSILSSDNTGISAAVSRTLTCWVKFSSKAIQCVMSIGANGANTGYSLETSSTVWLFGYGNSGTASTITYDANQWYHVALVGTFVSGTTLSSSLYINGVLRQTNSNASINTTNSVFRIGNNPSGTVFLNGSVSQAKIYRKALSSNDISENFDDYRSRYGV
jgi:hypothetical protein